LLTKIILLCNHHYYRTTNPLLSDGQYDRLYAQLVDLENTYPHYTNDDSPTRSLSDQKIDGYKKIEHVAPLLSLQNTYNENDIRAR
jgi:DNA ligase (NAD+)